MNAVQIKINTSEFGAESSELMKELTQMLQAQSLDRKVSVVEKTVAIPNTKGVVLSEVLLTLAFEVAKDVVVALLIRLANDLIDKHFTKTEAKHVSVMESPNGVVITNNGSNNTYSVTVNVVDD